jgi:hypothetical protein
MKMSLGSSGCDLTSIWAGAAVRSTPLPDQVLRTIDVVEVRWVLRDPIERHIDDPRSPAKKVSSSQTPVSEPGGAKRGREARASSVELDQMVRAPVRSSQGSGDGAVPSADTHELSERIRPDPGDVPGHEEELLERELPERGHDRGRRTGDPGTRAILK